MGNTGGIHMGEKLVLYASAYGNTRVCAQYIARRLGCRVLDIRKLTKEELTGVDTVVFGGWLCGGAVAGTGRLSAHADWFEGKKLVAFVTGAGDYAGTSRFCDIVACNFMHPAPLRAFYVRGGVDYRKMHWYHKFLINYLMVEDTKGERKKLRVRTHFFDRQGMERIVGYIKNL